LPQFDLLGKRLLSEALGVDSSCLQRSVNHLQLLAEVERPLLTIAPHGQLKLSKFGFRFSKQSQTRLCRCLVIRALPIYNKSCVATLMRLVDSKSRPWAEFGAPNQRISASTNPPNTGLVRLFHSIELVLAAAGTGRTKNGLFLRAFQITISPFSKTNRAPQCRSYDGHFDPAEGFAVEAVFGW